MWHPLFCERRDLVCVYLDIRHCGTVWIRANATRVHESLPEPGPAKHLRTQEEGKLSSGVDGQRPDAVSDPFEYLIDITLDPAQRLLEPQRPFRVIVSETVKMCLARRFAHDCRKFTFAAGVDGSKPLIAGGEPSQIELRNDVVPLLFVRHSTP